MSIRTNLEDQFKGLLDHSNMNSNHPVKRMLILNSWAVGIMDSMKIMANNWRDVDPDEYLKSLTDELEKFVDVKMKIYEAEFKELKNGN